MSVQVAASTAPHQPYQCLVCHSRFTRHENLKRHAALHARSQDEHTLSCDFCHATFSRSDLRQRHLKRKHPELVQSRTKNRPPHDTQVRDRGRLQKAPSSASSVSPVPSHQSLDSQHADGGSTGRQSQAEAIPDLASWIEPSQPINIQLHPTSVSQFHTLDTISANIGFNPSIPEFSPTIDSPQVQHGWCPSAPQTARGCQLFFDHVSHFVPFLHRPTYNPKKAAHHLLLAVLCLGYQYGDDPECSHEAASGLNLSEHCFHQAHHLVACESERTDDLDHNVAMVQTYLLLQLYSMFYSCGEQSTYGLRAHSTMISLIRAGGLMQAIPTESALTEDLDSLWREFAKVESLKRTLFAVHQMDTLWYQFLSIPRSLSHLEIKHDLPCPLEYWTAATSGEWAHRQLKSKHSSVNVQYSDAVRRFLSSDADISSVPAFDAYGAINLTQFLVSSAREISGWCTMTGMLSVERLEPLKSSLFALSPFIRSQPATAKAAQAVLCEATWESAMIEVQMWSPSHTGGIVQGSIDAVLHQLTSSGPCCEFLCEPNTAKVIQPHVDWFLRYLDATLVPDQEAPWVTLYAYKAFMIAWQLLQGGVAGAMQAVSVHDGDATGALAWARGVFWRRRRWQLGKLIMTCLDTLDNHSYDRSIRTACSL